MELTSGISLDKILGYVQVRVLSKTVKGSTNPYSSMDRATEPIPHLADLGAGLLNRLEEFDSPMGVYENKK